MIAALSREIVPAIFFVAIMALVQAAGHAPDWRQTAVVIVVIMALFGVHNLIVRATS